MTKKSRRVAKARRALLTLSLVLVVAFAAVGGTVAWLTASTGEITNTFTIGNVDVALKEHVYNLEENKLTDAYATTGNSNYKIIPGLDLPKDPKVSVTAASEDSWVFVEVTETAWPTVTESDNTTKKVKYEIADGWTLLTSSTNGVSVYYRQHKLGVEDSWSVLKGDKVEVSENLTKTEIDDIDETTPSLKFKAYAIQLEGFEPAADAADAEAAELAAATKAWTEVSK